MSLPLGYQFMTILFKIQGYEATKILQVGNRIEIFVEPTMRRFCQCGLSDKLYDSTPQRFYIGSVLGRAVYAVLKVYRIECPECGIKTEYHGLSEGKRRYSPAVGKAVIRYTELLDNKSVSKLLGISKDMVYRIDKEELWILSEKYERSIPFGEMLSVDEVSYKRGHNYATVLTNYEDGKVIWLESDRRSGDLIKAYEKLGDNLGKITTVAMDFWAPYEKATRKKIPKAQIVFDRFHLSRILNRKIEEERREYQNGLPEEERKEIKKGCRWLILKRRENFTDNHEDQLAKLKEKNEPLYEIYLLKEDFLEIFKPERSREEGKLLINDWITRVIKLKYKKLKSFARTVQKRLDAILNWFDCPISNGKAEGVNNVIKTLLKRAYGYKDFDYFRLKVLQKCGHLMENLPAEL